MDIERKRGDTRPDTFIITDGETWEPVNLTGCSFTLAVDSRAGPTDESTLVYKLTGTSSTPLTGKIELSPSVAQANLVGNYYYELQMVDATGKIHTVAGGRYVYKQDIAK